MISETGNQRERSDDRRLVCRDAVVEDGPAIARVWVAAWQAAYQALMPAGYLAGLDAEAALPGFERHLRAGPSLLVLELDGNVLGFSCYGETRDQDAGPDTGEVIAINLHPAHWRRGLGRTLLRETAERLRGRGFSAAVLWVLDGNASARRFYEALGWQLDGAEKHSDELTGFVLHEVRYRVALR